MTHGSQPPIEAPTAAGLQDDARLEASRFSNFDVIRLFAAAGVIFSHSFLLGQGSEAADPVQRATGEITGIYCVYVFFVLSGFLITRSWFTTRDAQRFAIKRFLRIYPAYAASIILAALVLGPIGYMGGALGFLRQPDLVSTLARQLGFLLENEAQVLPGVVLYSAPNNMGPVLNGVLWTIVAEIELYAAVALLGAFRLLRIETAFLLAALGLSLHLSQDAAFLEIGRIDGGHFRLDQWGLNFGMPPFFAGSFLYFVFRRHTPSGSVALLLALAAVIVPFMDLGKALGPPPTGPKLFSVLCAYPVLWLGSRNAPDLGSWTRWGDLSYGLYVFGWPVQQALRTITGPGLSGWEFFALCLPCALAVAWLSWRFVERPALRFKPLGPAPPAW